MWDNAEVVVLADETWHIRAVSRNEEEALIKDVMGRHLMHRVAEESIPAAEEAIRVASSGQEVELLVASIADDGTKFWSRVHAQPSPVEESWTLVHSRRLPRAWEQLSPRERDVIRALHTSKMNPKRAARALGISLNTLNSHRRSISQKCGLRGVGDFWVFVEQCR